MRVVLPRISELRVHEMTERERIKEIKGDIPRGEVEETHSSQWEDDDSDRRPSQTPSVERIGMRVHSSSASGLWIG
ncbi:MAG: hypothetical protein QXK42_03480 [Candidatus Korarchaeum sp.]